MPPRQPSPPPAAASSSSEEGLIQVLLLQSIDPEQPDNNDWIHLAARVYCASGIHMTPAELERTFVLHLREQGGYAAAKAKAQEIASTNPTYKSMVMLVDGPPFVADSCPSTTQSIHAASSSSSSVAAAVATGAGGLRHKATPTKEEVATRSADITASSTIYSIGAIREAKSREMSPGNLLDIVQMFRAIEGFDVFEEPVGPRVVNTVMSSNNYASVVRRPVSISSVRTAVYDGSIRTPQALEQAIWNMAANCVYFNVPEGPYPGIARRFAAACTAIINRESGLR
jgi:hypothetical protein